MKKLIVSRTLSDLNQFGRAGWIDVVDMVNVERLDEDANRAGA
jgi:hypothetical protein